MLQHQSFKVHSKSRKVRAFTARVVFFLLGFLPLAGTMCWGTYRCVYENRASYENWLLGQTGLNFHIGKVDHIGPGQLRFRDLQIRDPETGERILESSAVEISRVQESRLFELSNVRLKQSDLHRLLRLINDRVLQQPRLLQQRLAFRIQEVQVESEALRDHANSSGALQRLHNAQLNLQRTPIGPQADIAFYYLDGQHENEATNHASPVRVYVVREMDKGAPITKLDFQSGDTALPCSLLTGLTMFKNLGHATFRGNLRLDYRASPRQRDAWTCEATGFVESLDLAQVTSLATGEADVTIRRATVDAGRLTRLDAAISIVDGQLATALVQSAIENLDLVANVELDDSPTIQFDRLGLDVLLSGRECQLTGIASETPGAMVVKNGEAFVSEPARTIQTIDLVRTVLQLPKDQYPIAVDAPILRALPTTDF